MKSKYRLGTFAVCALVALRLGIGWHFANEGLSKLKDGFSAEMFLDSAKGPFADYFHSFIWDRNGKMRLGFDRKDIPEPTDSDWKSLEQGRPTINLAPTIEAWEQYREDVILAYGFDDRQKRAAQTASGAHIGRLRQFFGDNREDIIKYFNALDRRADQLEKAEFAEVDTLYGQGMTLVSDLKKSRRGWLQTVDRLWNGYESDLLAIATDEQKQSVEAPRLEGIGKPGWGTEFVNWFIPRLDLTIGILLIIGFLTRYASIAAALFLGSVIVAQWPGATGAAPVYYQSVEALGLLVLASMGAGRFAGLDYFTYYLVARCCPPKTGNTNEQSYA